MSGGDSGSCCAGGSGRVGGGDGGVRRAEAEGDFVVHFQSLNYATLFLFDVTRSFGGAILLYDGSF
jgi:hypothetical protein